MMPGSIDVRPVTHASVWICGHCVICDAWVDPAKQAWWTERPAQEVYANGEATGFMVCDTCRARPAAALLDALARWATQVWEPVGGDVH